MEKISFFFFSYFVFIYAFLFIFFKSFFFFYIFFNFFFIRDLFIEYLGSIWIFPLSVDVPNFTEENFGDLSILSNNILHAINKNIDFSEELYSFIAVFSYEQIDFKSSAKGRSPQSKLNFVDSKGQSQRHYLMSAAPKIITRSLVFI